MLDKIGLLLDIYLGTIGVDSAANLADWALDNKTLYRAYELGQRIKKDAK